MKTENKDPASPASAPVVSDIPTWQQRALAAYGTDYSRFKPDSFMAEEIADLRAALAAPVAPVASDERAQEIDRRKRLTFTLSQCVHNMVVAEQSAWIEWKHGKGAEAAMEWIENGLMGPGHLPNHDGLTAQDYFNANVDERMEPPAAAPLPPAAAPAPELTEDKRNAERYRWLRDKKANVSLVIDKRTDWVPQDESVPGVGGYWMYEYRAGEELDTAIDAAIQAQGSDAA